MDVMGALQEQLQAAGFSRIGGGVTTFSALQYPGPGPAAGVITVQPDVALEGPDDTSVIRAVSVFWEDRNHRRLLGTFQVKHPQGRALVVRGVVAFVTVLLRRVPS